MPSRHAEHAYYFGHGRNPRDGFTVMEVVVATGILTVAMVLVAQLGYWSLRERARTAARQVAIELAANVLESARAQPWEDLNSEWAATQKITDELSDLLTDGNIAVTVESDQSFPHAKQVSVEIRWSLYEGIESRPVRLVGWFTPRAIPGEGENP